MFVCVTECAWTSFYRTYNGDVTSHFTSTVAARRSLARHCKAEHSVDFTNHSLDMTVYLHASGEDENARAQTNTHLGTHVHNYPHVLLYTHNYLQIFPPIYWQIYANMEKILVFKWNSLIVKKIGCVPSLLSNIDFY